MKYPKSIAASTLCCLASVGSFSHADTVLGLYAGGGVWNADLSGNVGTDAEPVTADELGFGSESNVFYFVALEHPIPFLPNVRLGHTGLAMEGSGESEREYTFEELTVPISASTQSKIDLSHTDLTLYFELLDNYVSWDLGLTGRSFDSYASIDYVTTDGSNQSGSERVNLKGTLPLLYTKLQLDLPFTGWYVGGSLNYIGQGSDSFSDLDAKLGYMTDGLGLDVGFDLGYRQMKLKVQELDDLDADLTTAGPYANLFVHF